MKVGSWTISLLYCFLTKEFGPPMNINRLTFGSEICRLGKLPTTATVESKANEVSARQADNTVTFDRGQYACQQIQAH